DIIPARQTNVMQSRNGWTWAFSPTADYVKKADITYVNLESPLFAGCKATSEGFQFCGDARNLQGLQLIGAKVANLANNHLGNYGPSGTQATVDLLEQNGIRTSGLGPPAVLDVRGLKFGFVGFNGVGLAIDREAVKAGIQHAREQADVVVVQFHWGKEYERQPMADAGVPTPDDPVEIGHLAIDAGADIVIGNHPHWYQGIEVYKNRLITYAHGNYVFDQMWSEETREGVIGTYTFYDNHLVAAGWKPLRIYQYGQAQWMNDADSANVLATMEIASKTLAARLGEPG
ncbi:MAG: CapA family protein, partial [Chloroflexota bacterium]